MTRNQRRGMTLALTALCWALLITTTAPLNAQQDAKKAHAFKGKVEQVDAKTKSLVVAGDNVPGWMMAMTMSYGVDQETVLKQVKAGDQITATVYDGDFKKLYNVKVVPPEKKK